MSAAAKTRPGPPAITPDMITEARKFFAGSNAQFVVRETPRQRVATVRIPGLPAFVEITITDKPVGVSRRRLVDIGGAT